MLLIRDLDTRSGHGRRARESAFADKSLGLPGIGFILDPVIMPRDDAVQCPSLFGVVGARAGRGPSRGPVGWPGKGQAGRCTSPVQGRARPRGQQPAGARPRASRRRASAGPANALADEKRTPGAEKKHFSPKRTQGTPAHPRAIAPTKFQSKRSTCSRTGFQGQRPGRPAPRPASADETRTPRPQKTFFCKSNPEARSATPIRNTPLNFLGNVGKSFRTCPKS